MRNRGFSIMEILIYMGIVAFFLAIAGIWQKQIRHIKAIKETKEKVAIIQEAIRRNFLSNLDYAEKNCYGWDDSLCSVIALFPIPVDASTLQFNTYDTSIRDVFLKAGCLVRGNVPNFTVQCYDGFGRLLQFQEFNYQPLGSDYYDYYLGNRFSLNITDSLNTRYVLDLNKELDWAYSRTQEKISEIGTGIKAYVRTKRIGEFENVCDTGGSPNDPAGGLHSADDALVPWIWQALGNSPLALCSGIEDTTTNCGCRDFDTTIWVNDSAYCVLDQNDEITRFLTNIGLGSRYKTDGFGNKITVVPLADANGNPINCPPERPKPYYDQYGISKTRVGIYDGTNWIYYIDVIGE